MLSTSVNKLHSIYGKPKRGKSLDKRIGEFIPWEERIISANFTKSTHFNLGNEPGHASWKSDYLILADKRKKSMIRKQNAC